MTPMHATDLSPRDRRLLWTVLAAVAGVVLFSGLGEFRTFGSHESLVAVPAREMLRSGDWTVPRFGGVPRLEKPPLGYWIVAACAAFVGEIDEWGARLPAALAAMGLALLMGGWARRWYGQQAAFATMLVQLTAAYVVLFGRKAEVDMVLWLCMTAALFLVAHQPDDEHPAIGFLRWSGFYVLLGAAWLAKFHYGPVMVLVPTIVFLLTDRPRRLWNLLNPLGLTVFAAAVVVWPLLVARQVPDAFATWRHETLGRAVGELGSEPWWFYGPHILWLMLPWTPCALAMARRSVRAAWSGRDSRERFLWIWFLSQLAIATLSVDKHKHYIACALPATSLLAGRMLVEACHWLLRRARPIPGRWLNGLGATFIAVSMAAVIIVRAVWPDVAVAAAAAGCVFLAGGLLALARSRRRAWRGMSVIVLCQLLGCYAIAVGWILPARDHRHASAEFARRIRELAGPRRPVIAYRMDQHPTLFYLGPPAARIESLEALAARLRGGRRLLVLTFEPFKNELLRTGWGSVLDSLPAESHGDYPKDGPLFLVEVQRTTDPPAVMAADFESQQHGGFADAAERFPISPAALTTPLSSDGRQADE